MNKKALSPWVLPVAGATTAVGAGLLGGINIDDWESMEPKEKAKKLLKCLVMGGIVGLGAEGVRQGYNQIKERALEKPASYKNSLLSNMLKQALAEENNISNENNTSTKKQTDLPEEASWGENTILGIPSHLAIGGGLGLAGGLTLYHFLTDKKKKKPTGYIGAGLGGLLTGVLGAGLFKGWSADEKNVKQDLYKRPETTTASDKLNNINLFNNNYFVGAPDIELNTEQQKAVRDADNKFVALTTQFANPNYAKAEANLYKALSSAIPNLKPEQFIQHVHFLNAVSDSKYRYDAAVNPENNTKYTDDYLNERQKWMHQQASIYNQPLDINMHAEDLNASPKLLDWVQKNNGDYIANKIIKHYYPDDTTLDKNPHALQWILNNKEAYNNPDMWKDLNLLISNLSTAHNLNIGLNSPHGNVIGYGDGAMLKYAPTFNENNRLLEYKYTNPKEFITNLLAEQKKDVYIPDSFVPSPKLNMLAENLRKLWYTPNISNEQLLKAQNALILQIQDEIANTNGLPRTGLQTEEDTLLQNMSGTGGSALNNLRNNTQYGLDNLKWKPYTVSGTTNFAKADLNDEYSIVAYKDSKTNKTVFNIEPNTASKYYTNKRKEFGDKTLKEFKPKHTFIAGGNAAIYMLNDGRFLFKDLKTNTTNLIEDPRKYLAAGRTSGIIPKDVMFASTPGLTSKIYGTKMHVPLTNNGFLVIDFASGESDYIPPSTPTV